MFGFLFLVFIILLITCSEATILLCYFHLCAEVPESSALNEVPFIKFVMLLLLPESNMPSSYPVFQGLPLVVAFLPDQRVHGRLSIHLCCALLLLKVTNNWSCQYDSVLWIYYDYGPHLLPLHR